MKEIMEYPAYTYPVSALFTGASLGNYLTFARLTAESDLDGLWSATDDEYYLGRWTMTFSCDGRNVQPQETRFAPESQTTILREDDLTIEKQFFIPFSRQERSLAAPSCLRTAIFLVRLQNAGTEAKTVTAHHVLTFPACPSAFFQKQPTPAQQERRVVVEEGHDRCTIRTKGKPGQERLFESPDRWSRISHDDSSLSLEYVHVIEAGDVVELPFVLTYAPDGTGPVTNLRAQGTDARTLLKESVRQYEAVLSRSAIATPNPVINRGIQWAKVNTVRVQHRYPSGFGFTNDPPQDIVVVRDLAWYIIGSDYVTPGFSRDLLQFCMRHAFHDGGKLTEYLHACEPTPELHDYDLNINDNTPLFVHAAYHHALTAGNDATLRDLYPFMKRACDWILGQRHDGLVRCVSEGSNVWGICGWRNIIDGYNLTGAVTEINAECAHALRCTSAVARRLGFAGDAVRYGDASALLHEAINEHLLSEKTGVYLLNRANDGSRRHDITGDLIFTILFGVALPEIAERILEKLTDDDMWTPYGSRTVSSVEPVYHPDEGCQLIGGLWPNLTAWIAYCLRKDRPEKLVEGMVNIYAYCEPARPIEFANVVPGQFPERIHGENYTSRGMAMSPWMPPTYLWLGVEGLLGVSAHEGGLDIDPALPAEWRWVGLKDLPVQGRTVTAFLFDGSLYADTPVGSRFPTKVGKLLTTEVSAEAIFAIAMLVDGDVTLFVTSDHDVTGHVVIHHAGVDDDREVVLRGGTAQLHILPAASRASIVQMEGAT